MVVGVHEGKGLTLGIKACLFTVLMLSGQVSSQTQFHEPCPKFLVDLGVRLLKENGQRLNCEPPSVAPCYCVAWKFAQDSSTYVAADRLFEELSSNSEWLRYADVALQFYYFRNRAQVKSDRLGTELANAARKQRVSFAQEAVARWEEFLLWFSELEQSDQERVRNWGRPDYPVEKAVASLGNAIHDRNAGGDAAKAVSLKYAQEIDTAWFGPDAITLWISCLRGYPKSFQRESITIDEAFLRNQIQAYPETLSQWKELRKAISSLAERRGGESKINKLYRDVQALLMSTLEISR